MKPVTLEYNLKITMDDHMAGALTLSFDRMDGSLFVHLDTMGGGKKYRFDHSVAEPFLRELSWFSFRARRNEIRDERQD